ncbi:hypothetical protein EOA27_08680 [Mesorhizobium sp. M2A.F.Ca.ET.037.01.1.1]|uniref:hypothetical protein n=1 Tax=unclassified Mesorhizobium TaxID=325217 RepID=UPI000F758700|nr:MULTISPECIES: hypothetical protein [unclassified Mesorhizobium]RUY12388.1 hypothetical protein EOA25_03465 [Mesorhizobium sp. M2A.F.Ca.ET.040.01.1.1]RVC77304.1 hypothetical protein EN766_11840 [Mesorhizobium sp. M2A.F.Ca.ET.046.02.1.1]AZO34275.1 hypothetical protein EJ072_07280 [Mesorhizobium sp. M2A.F.Ca.ET.046.03.2.1]RUX20404.1 hypothetical protein EOA27_08680 [Mesorhizobium sp. M2A.F.Ca.ET.037.01.1.1]RWA89988.1 MAG: hypothetical protein EOQ31_14985 [Mesorhizobium sp.]
MGFLRTLLILAVVGAVAAGAVALTERFIFDSPKPAVSGEPPPLPVIKKKPVRQWKWRLT